MRIFPPGLVLRKLVTQPYEFINKNGVRVQVKPGDVVILPVKALHYDPQYYEDPETFKPERFLEENGGMKKYRDQGVYFGFGDGPRICPGKSVCDSKLFQSFRCHFRSRNALCSHATQSSFGGDCSQL